MTTENPLVTIFSGNEFQAYALSAELEQAGVLNMIRNDQQTGNFMGLGSIQFSVHVLIEESFMEKALPIIQEFNSRNKLSNLDNH
jgi:hypothetical protein